jgi:hypothetical protein
VPVRRTPERSLNSERGASCGLQAAVKNSARSDKDYLTFDGLITTCQATC